MFPSNAAETTEQVFDGFDSTLDNCFPITDGFPSLGDPRVNLIQIQSPFMFDDIDNWLTGCDDGKDADRLETGLPVPLSQTEAGEERTCQASVIPLTVLELDVDETANASPERTSSATDGVLITSRSGTDDNKRVRGDVRRSQPSQGSSGGTKTTKTRKFSVTSPPLKSPSLFCRTGNTETVSDQSVRSHFNDVKNGDTGPRILELRYGNNATMDTHNCSVISGNQMTTTPLTEMSSEVPVVRLERRRAQNREAATRCRTKRKREEDQLKKDFELATKDNRVKRQEIQDLASQIKRLKTELHRHESTDHCFVQVSQLQSHLY